MKRIALLTVIAAALGASSCAHFKPIVDGAQECATEAGKATVDEVLPKVNEAIGCSIADVHQVPQCALDGVEALAREYAKDFVLCALQQIAAGKLATPGDTEAGVKQRRAKAILEQQKPQADQSLKGGGGLATTAGRVGAPPNEGPDATNARPVAPGADDPGVLSGSLTLTEPLPEAFSFMFVPSDDLLPYSIGLMLPGGGEFVLVRIDAAGHVLLGV